MTELLAVTCSTVPDAGETMPSAERRKTVYNATWSVYVGQIEEIFNICEHSTFTLLLCT